MDWDCRKKGEMNYWTLIVNRLNIRGARGQLILRLLYRLETALFWGPPNCKAYLWGLCFHCIFTPGPQNVTPSPWCLLRLSIELSMWSCWRFMTIPFISSHLGGIVSSDNLCNSYIICHPLFKHTVWIKFVYPWALAKLTFCIDCLLLIVL